MIPNTFNWQHLPQNLNPVSFYLGPVAISWYGIMYLVAFAVVYFLVRHRIRKRETDISLETVKEFFPWGIAGLLVGARLGDVFIYDWKYFSAHPLEIFLPFDVHNGWQYIGIYGMSYFGGLIGLTLAFVIFAILRFDLGGIRRSNLDKILEFSDLFAPAVPLAFTFGRIGNFLNGELYGRVTHKFWGMYFPADFSGQLRHPSQLYEAFFEGILLFVILWTIRRKIFPVGYLTSFYLISYGIARFLCEFFREPDNNWFFFSLTIGQWLSITIIIVGLLIILRKRKQQILFAAKQK